MSDLDRVAAHYHGEGIAERLLGALAAEGVDMDNLTPVEMAPIDQFHGRGLVATQDMCARLKPEADDAILDIGCGLGGPARYVAHAHGSRVTGIDLTPAYCEAAEALSKAARLDGQVTIKCASATDLPFDDASFDAAFSQNVAMNIADKAAYFGEALRVLKPGGRAAMSILAQGPAGEVRYPVPWAETPATSFLAEPDDLRAQIEAAGFEILDFIDETETAIAAYRQMREIVKRDGPPKLGAHLFMGERMKQMMRNIARSTEDGRIVPLEVLCRKP